MGLRCIGFTLLLAACASAPQPRSATNPEAALQDTRAGQLALATSDPQVERIFDLPPSDASPKRGSAVANVTALVCSDFECPFCAQLKPTLDELEQKYGDRVRFEWRNCPLPFHEFALPAAEAAAEVFVQKGDRAFWAYHDVLFAHQDALEPDKLVQYAGGIAGIDREQVAQALADRRHLERVAADLRTIAESGAASGGFGTPATFINGRLISGAQPYEVFSNAIERALSETPAKRAQAIADSKNAYPVVRVRHVLIQWQGARGAGDTVKRSKDEALQLARTLHGEVVKNPIDFGEIAKKHSDCPSASEGGELGRFTRGEVLPEFESAMFSLEPGQISSVVETPFGYHVILREE